MLNITHHQGTSTQNHDEISPLKLTIQETDAGEHVEKGEPSCTAGGNANWCRHSGK